MSRLISAKLNSANTKLVVLLLCLSAAIFSHAQTFTTLSNFTGSEGTVRLVQSTDGNFYGTTSAGGTGFGTIVEITPTGTTTVLYSFCAQPSCTDGAYPQGLIQAINGKFFGTTAIGGANDAGTVFEITSTGTLTVLHSFTGTDGAEPLAGLIQGTNGHFYGTTEYGGANNDGAIFEITPQGALTTLHSFTSADGELPMAPVLQGTDGNFYGTTTFGGANAAGTVFKINATGVLTTLYSFCAQQPCLDGQGPLGLIQATNGNLYGITNTGGTSGYGTVFEITTVGAMTPLYSFCSQGSPCADGYFPFAGLIQATDGNLYGTTEFGGDHNFYGTVFSVTPAGDLSTPHSFDITDGSDPVVGLFQSTNGTLYGTTTQGGTGGIGTFFSLSMGLGPFVETQPPSGKVATAVTILGNNLTGATSVTFNGKTATFTVVSSTEITTKVPTGATSGKVRVKTATGTLTSNVGFRVTK